MKKLLLLTMVVSGVAAQAQTELASEIDSALVGIESQEAAPSGAAIAPQGSVSGQPIYILNQATPNAQVQTGAQVQVPVQKQQTVNVNAAPLTKSRAEEIREARQQTEVETENRIVEKLEQSRIEDEKRRASVLFGDQFNQLNNGQPNQNMNNQQQVQTVAPVQVDTTRDVIREELRAALKAEEEAPVVPVQTKYFGLVGGIGDYPEAKNVSSNYTFGASFGVEYDSSYAFEGSLLYSSFDVDQYTAYGNGYAYNPYTGSYNYVPAKVHTNQYAGSLALKYLLLDGMIRPTVGAMLQFTYRNYSWANAASAMPYGYGYGYGYGYPNSYTGGVNDKNSADSSAFDMGLTAGADIKLTNKFTLGVDYKYLWNLTHRINSESNSWMEQYSSYYGTQLEKLQNWNLTVSGKMMF